jgi:hypothetical protein
MLNETKTMNTTYAGHQYEIPAVDPKNKSEGKKEKLLNRQDDNSYDEVEETKEPKKEQGKQEDTNKDFEYSDSGEFQNDSVVTDTNPNDEYL